MYGVVLLIAVALVTLLVARVATIALSVTGMATPMARFQARSALSGVGFTTTEAEAVVNHPVRRRVIMALMLIGNVGIVTAMAGVLMSMLGTDSVEGGLTRGFLLVLGLAAVYVMSRSELVDRHLSRLIAKGLRRFTDLDARDYARLLQLSGEYAVKEMRVAPDSWLASRTLGELRLRDEGVLVLGVMRSDGSYVGVPSRETCLDPADNLVIYGSDTAVSDLDGRPPGSDGDRRHEEAVVRHRSLVSRGDVGDPGQGR
jgi:K+/H+ antiporter YhaU regulatory subunit KhtT